MKKIVLASMALAAVAGCAGGHLSESQEYYVGRAMAAQAVADSKGVYDNEDLYGYVAKVGWSVALASDRPDTYLGYNFVVLRSDQVAAWAAPSGFIFVTTAALSLMENEDQLAAVLAHEIAHVNLKHPEEVARKAAGKAGVLKLLEAGGAILSVFMKKEEGEKLQQLVKGLGAVVDDLGEAAISGYSRESEMAADKLAVDILTRGEVKYNPHALADFLARLPKKDGKAAQGPYATHPGVEERIEAVRNEVKALGKTFRTEPGRTERFNRMKRLIRP